MEKSIAKQRFSTFCFTSIIIAFLCFFAIQLPMTYASEDIIKLKWSNYYPDAGPIGHDIHAKTADFIEEQMKGRIKFDRYWAGSLHSLADGFKALRSGLTDVTQTYVFNNSGAFDLMNADFLPYLFKTAISATATWDELYPKWFKKEFERQGIYAAMHPSFGYVVIVSKRPIRTLEDLKGMKIMAHGGFLRDAIENMGGTPVFVTPPDLFLALQRGVIDAVVWAPGCVIPWRFNEVARYCTITNLSRGIINFGLDKATFDKMPKDVQKDFYHTMRLAGNFMSEQYHILDEKGMEAMKADGMELITLSPEENERWHKASSKTWDQFTAKMKKKNIPVDEFVKDLRATADKFNAMSVDEIREYTEKNPVHGIITGF